MMSVLSEVNIRNKTRQNDHKYRMIKSVESSLLSLLPYLWSFLSFCLVPDHYQYVHSDLTVLTKQSCIKGKKCQ